MRRFTGDTLVVATHNQGKVREFADLLGEYVRHFPSAGELGLPEPEETETTFIGNAVLKAVAAAKASNLPALGDDSGLAVDALGGAPGIYSARWAGEPRDFTVAMARVQRELPPNADTTARFICALALAWPDGHIETVQGEIQGRLVFPGRGNKGFGYDPIFQPDGDTRTYGEIDMAEKRLTSHRAKGFRELVQRCFR